MKLSNYQAQLLLQVLCDSLAIENHFGFAKKSREELYKQIINQQDKTLKDLDNKKSYAEMQMRGAEAAMGLCSGIAYGWGMQQARCQKCDKPHAGMTCEEVSR